MRTEPPYNFSWMNCLYSQSQFVCWMAGKMSMTIHLLLQLWSPFDFCSQNHFSDGFQVFTDGSLLAILILPIILAFFLLNHAARHEWHWHSQAPPNVAFDSYVWAAAGLWPSPKKWSRLCWQMILKPSMIRLLPGFTYILMKPQPAASEDFPYEARAASPQVVLPCAAFVTFIDPLLRFFFGGVGRRRRADHIGMQRCLQEVEVLDLDWGPMRSPLESLPSTNFIQWGYSYT